MKGRDEDVYIAKKENLKGDKRRNTTHFIGVFQPPFRLVTNQENVNYHERITNWRSNNIEA